jgi:hypothetical protein
MVSSPICSIPDCDYKAKERCIRCGEVFCTLHITSTPVGYFCDTCRVEYGEEVDRKIRKGFWKGVFMNWIGEILSILGLIKK